MSARRALTELMRGSTTTPEKPASLIAREQGGHILINKLNYSLNITSQVRRAPGRALSHTTLPGRGGVGARAVDCWRNEGVWVVFDFFVGFFFDFKSFTGRKDTHTLRTGLKSQIVLHVISVLECRATKTVARKGKTPSHRETNGARVSRPVTRAHHYRHTGRARRAADTHAERRLFFIIIIIIFNRAAQQGGQLNAHCV